MTKPSDTFEQLQDTVHRALALANSRGDATLRYLLEMAAARLAEGEGQVEAG